MKLDAGFAASVRSRSKYEKTFKNNKLRETPMLLKTSIGEKIVPIGVMQANVEYNNKQRLLDLHVIEKGGPSPVRP